MKQPQKVFLSLTATRAEGEESTKLELKREMECSIVFLAAAIKAAMEDDDILASAIALAAMEVGLKIDIEKFKENLKDLTVQNNN